ncbi:TIGR00266 family protein [Desulfonauticus submarinus]|uniref:TIGR00266 family protein n=1 Tax=Desulfonauticus submarinus TaxID=206665 RepID=A0A1H0CDY2_9BACT|nr:TIGR00266 family protein [Desulfonauticus submarinus]SDN56107.1 TIGR00266 family protein [Desulfonauticus submarinus]
MKTKILFQGSYALLKVNLDPGEEIKAEPGAMVAMTEAIKMEVKKSGGGLFKSLKAKFLGGESFFNTYFKAQEQSGHLFLAPKSPGSIAELTLDGSKGFILEKGAFLAATPDVNLDVKFQGLAKGFLNKEGFFLIKVEGTGNLFLNCFGGLEKINLASGEKFIVDNGHLVAFSSDTDYKITKAGGWLSSIFSGEGIVLEFSGPGEVYIQSRNPGEFGRWLLPFIPIPTPSGGSGGSRFGFAKNNTWGSGEENSSYDMEDSFDDSFDDE